MKIDLLGESISNRNDYDLLKALNLFEITEEIIKDNKNRSVFLDVISKNVSNPFDVKFRRDIIKEMIQNKSDLTDCIETVHSIIEICDTKIVPESNTLSEVENNLVALSKIINSVFENIRILYDSFEKFNFQNQTLSALCERFRILTFDDNVIFLKETATKILNYSLIPSITGIEISVNNNCEITDTDITIQDNAIFQINQTNEKYLIPALSNIAESFLSQINNFKCEFSYYEYCLRFYEGSMIYVKYLKSKNIDYTFSTIRKSNNVIFNNLCDLTIIVENRKGASTFTYDSESVNFAKVIIEPSQKKRISFIRAIGTAILFSLQGLPIPAECAEIPFYYNMSVLISDETNPLKSFERQIETFKNYLTAKESSGIILLDNFGYKMDYPDLEEYHYEIIQTLRRKSVSSISSFPAKLAGYDDTYEITESKNSFVITRTERIRTR